MSTLPCWDLPKIGTILAKKTEPCSRKSDVLVLLRTFPLPCITVGAIGSKHAIMMATGIAIALAVASF